MKLTTKGRYGLAVIVLLNKTKGKIRSLNSIALSLGLSKIYLEQILSVLKSHHLVDSIKGPNGGYTIKSESFLNVYDILSALEPGLASQAPVEPLHPALGKILDIKVYQPLNQTIEHQLRSISINELSNLLSDEPMYYI